MGTPAGAFGDVRINFLSPLSVRPIPKKTFDYFENRTERKTVYSDLYAKAKNLARNYKVKIVSPQPQSGEEMKALIKELSKKIDEEITIVRFEEGQTELYHSVQLEDDCTCYFIPLAPATSMRHETGQLVQRFVTTLAKATCIHAIDGSPTFECFYQDFEFQMESTEDEAEKENIQQQYETFKDLHDGETASRINTAFGLKKLTRQEIEDFKAASPAEERLKSLLLEGYDFVDMGFNIWDYAESCNEILADNILMNSHIDTGDLLMVVWENDEVCDFIVEQLNELANCGAEQEHFIAFEPVPRRGKCLINSKLKKFFPFISELIDAINDNDLKTGKTQKQCQRT